MNGGIKKSLMLDIFGCLVVMLMHVPVEKRKKLDKKSVKCVFVGYPNQSKGYKLYEPSTGKMLRSRDVIFIENEFSNPCDGNDEPDELFPDKWFQSNMFNLHDDYLPDKEKTIDPLNDAVVDVRNDDSETEPLVNLESEMRFSIMMKFLKMKLGSRIDHRETVQFQIVMDGDMQIWLLLKSHKI